MAAAAPPRARVANISTIAAHRGGGEAYAASKAGLIVWGFELAGRSGKDGITVASGMRPAKLTHLH